MPPTLAEIQNLARQAGDILRCGYGQPHQVHFKGPVDPVTEVDHRSDEFLIGWIREHFPEDTIITEESGELAGANANRWYIDPLDGTVNYSHGIPIYCVSLAYADAQGMRLGVAYDPNLDECFSAERGKGAWLADQPIHVSSTSELIRSLLVTGFPYDILSTEYNNLDNFGRLSRLTQGVRRLGSAVLDFCYLACGRFDGFWELKLSPWDVAAGSLIAREAGALVTNAQGNPDFMRPPYSVLVANPALHAVILEALQ